MLKITDFDDMPYNLDGLDTVKNSFEDFCTHIMKLWISKTFGYLFFKTMDTELAKSEEEIGEQWKNLRDGAEYDESKKEWAGLKSLLIPIVYYEWVRETIARISPNGRIVTRNENSELADQSIYLSRAYNEFSDHCSSMYAYITENEDDFPEITFTDPGRTNIFNL
jgi:hypothetical protein